MVVMNTYKFNLQSINYDYSTWKKW